MRRTRSTCLLRHVMAAYLVHGVSISGFNGPCHISGLSQMLGKQQLRGRAPSAIMHESLCEARLSGRPIPYFKCHRKTTYFDDPSAGSTTQTRLPEKKIPVCDLLDLIR